MENLMKAAVEAPMKAMDQIENMLGHSPHPAIVAVPIGAWVTAAVADGLALVTGKSSYDAVASTGLGVGLVSSVGALLTGFRDFTYIPTGREPSHSIAIQHATGNMLATSLFVTSYLLRVRAKNQNRAPSLVARFLSLSGTALIGYTGWLGGKLVEEQGEAVKPVIKLQSHSQPVPQRASDG